MLKMNNLIRNLQHWVDGKVYDFFIDYIKFDERIFEGKRILIVGAAAFNGEEAKILKRDQFDIIINFNGSFDNDLEFQDSIEPSYQILFTNLDKAPKVRALLRRTVNHVVIRIPEKNLIHLYFRYFFKAVMTRLSITTVDIAHWNEAKRYLDGYTPTQGFLAVYLALIAGSQSVTMIGFSFFETEWVQNHTIYSISDYKMPREHSPAHEKKFLKDWASRDRRLTFGHLTKGFVRE